MSVIKDVIKLCSIYLGWAVNKWIMHCYFWICTYCSLFLHFSTHVLIAEVRFHLKLLFYSYVNWKVLTCILTWWIDRRFKYLCCWNISLPLQRLVFSINASHRSVPLLYPRNGWGGLWAEENGMSGWNVQPGKTVYRSERAVSLGVYAKFASDFVVRKNDPFGHSYSCVCVQAVSWASQSGEQQAGRGGSWPGSRVPGASGGADGEHAGPHQGGR